MNTATDRPYTLSDIAAAANVQKRAAQNWLRRAKSDHGEIGEIIDNTRRFSPDERDLLLTYAAPPKPAKVAPVQTEQPGQDLLDWVDSPAKRTQQIEAFPEFAGAAPASNVYAPPEPRSVEIVEGNHRLTLDGPQLGGEISLARFRGDLEVRTYADPQGTAAAALALFDALGSAMDKDLDQSFQQLETTAATVQQLNERAEALSAKQLEYQITQKILARLQNQKTSELSELLGKAEALGGGGSQ